MPELHLAVLPPAQQQVWRLLQAHAADLRAGGYYLAGGTALALHLGHRQSHDFDFFSQATPAPEQPPRWLEGIPGYLPRAIDPGALHGEVGGVKLSLIAGYRYTLLEPPLATGGLLLAGPQDIGAMKLLAVTHRATMRDYLDLAALITHGYGLSDLLAASTRKYGPRFDPMLPLRALTAFGDLDSEMPVLLDPGLATTWQDTLRTAVRRVALGG